MTKKFITIKEDSYDEFVEKKSTFITHLIRINSEEEAREFIQKMKKKHYDATHVCSCYVYGDNNEITRANDDGEPSGTAGKPMGDIINYMEVTNLVVIATRYFGGIKLGAGGLVRNYAKTAKLAITEAEIIDFIDKIDLIFEISYERLGEVEKLLKDYEAEVIDKSFLEKIIFKVRINKDFYDNLENHPFINLLDI